MSEWWTYRLSDLLLFSPDTYYRLFELYNRELWPAQLLALALGVAIPLLIVRKPPWRGRAVSAILAAAWLWIGWGYHLERYATINWAAPWFGAAFAVQAGLLTWTGLIRRRLDFGSTRPALTHTGLALYLVALLAYPLITPLTGRPFAEAQVFGIAPDPTAIGTLGILLLARDRTRWALLVIPVLWCAVTGATLWTMGSFEAWVAPLAALAAIGVAVGQTFRRRPGGGQ